MYVILLSIFCFTWESSATATNLLQLFDAPFPSLVTSRKLLENWTNWEQDHNKLKQRQLSDIWQRWDKRKFNPNKEREKSDCFYQRYRLAKEYLYGVEIHSVCIHCTRVSAEKCPMYYSYPSSKFEKLV